MPSAATYQEVSKMGITASTISSYITTNWTVTPPGTITTGPSINQENSLVITQSPDVDLPIAAGLREVTSSVKLRLSYNGATGITQLLTHLRAYAAGQHKLQIETDYLGLDIVGYEVWEVIVREKNRY